MNGNPLIHFYRTPAFSPAKTAEILSLAGTHLSPRIVAVETEYCFYTETISPLTRDESGILRWLLSETFEQEKFGENSFLNPPIPPLPRGGVGGVDFPLARGESGGVITPDAEVMARNEMTKQSQIFQRDCHVPKAFGTRNDAHLIIEVGPRMNFSTAWSTNAVSVCHACGLTKITRIERSRRYKLVSDHKIPPHPPLAKGGSRGGGFPLAKGGRWKDELPLAKRGLKGGSSELSTSQIQSFLDYIHDRMTECEYPQTLTSFATGMKPESVYIVPLIEEGRDALKKINTELGLGLDEWDIGYYYNLFVNEIGRNPTSVECFDLGQSNSEHSRHWFFQGRLIIDGKEMEDSLIQIIKQPLKRSAPNNSVIAFKDNSSGIRGYEIMNIFPEIPGAPARFQERRVNYDIIFTAETHNFPTGVAPFPGAETGTGGRIRDVHATGRGSLVVAGTAAYCVGNLNIPGYSLPWEDPSFLYPTNLASPLQIEIEASNGASDYGNKFGEPVIQGFTRSFGIRLPDGERREWVKPIMFTGGIGQIDARHTEKREPEKGMLVIKIGGPAYRIGMGGGAASSMIQGENIAELDFSAVQRGDAEMEQKANRVIRACVEMGDGNPIVSIHDQGAGGNCNVVKEIIYPAGAKIEIRKIQLGDTTLSVLEIWGAEYQEQDALLLQSHRKEEFLSLCTREKVPCAVIGEITGDGFIVLYDETDGSTPVNLDLAKVLGAMPQKTFKLERVNPALKPLRLPEDLTVREALERVLRLVSVGSKKFLTNKVDRSVTGLIARQQCVGPLQLPLSNVAVIGQSHFGLTGAAMAIGEQPVKGLVSPQAMARMSVGEALTNIMWAKISALEDIKCSGNWMWAAKLPGEGAKIYDAAVALRDVLIALGIAIDGGKDSLSMAALVEDQSGGTEIVKSPGALVLSAYATCPDITKVITPDIKTPGTSSLLYIDLGTCRYRMGGTSLAHVYGQTGDESPDLDDPGLLKQTFNVIQKLIGEDMILSGHDRSDGGLIVTLLEMAFSGNCGIEVNILPPHPPLAKGGSREGNIPLTNGESRRDELPLANGESGADELPFPKGESRLAELPLLFSEELGLVIEYLPEHEENITASLRGNNIPFQIIGRTLSEKQIKIEVDNQVVLNEDMSVLREMWGETSYQLDRLQANPECVDEEKKKSFRRKGPAYRITFTPEKTPETIRGKDKKSKIAVIREEGSNGDREMTSAFYHAGFEVWDVTMTDILGGRVSLDAFRGVVFVGGFSYADVLDSAKGWAGVIRFNKSVFEQFERFYARPDTFSLGVCNGCQLMALLGWVPWKGIPDTIQPRFIRNRPGRFESRFSTVRILRSPAVMLRGMEDSVLGVWIAHGEGRLHFPDREMIQEVLDQGLAPVRFVDDNGEFTETYPFNPNGSPQGITALCSPDGRHLAMMPHPERTFLKWQWAYMPEKWKRDLDASPWLRMFRNAQAWCEKG